MRDTPPIGREDLETLDLIERARRCGDFARLDDVSGRTQSAKTSVHPRVSLALARGNMAAGQLQPARVWLDTAHRVASPDCALRVLVDLLAAQHEIFRSMALRPALEVAQRVENRLARDLAEAPPDLLFEARWNILRIRLMAATLGETLATPPADVVEELEEVERGLRALGRNLAAHHVACLRAQRADAALQLDLWDEIAHRGRRTDRLEETGEGLLGKVEGLLATAAPEDMLFAFLEEARDAFDQARHRHGSIDVDVLRARVEIERQGQGLEPLGRAVEDYLAVAYPRGALVTAMEWSTHAHRRGERQVADAARQTIDRIATDTGYRMIQQLSVFREVDLALREHRAARARDLCDAALDRGLPRGMEAGLRALRAGALMFGSDREGAVAERRRAIALYEELGREAEASEQIPALASDLAASRTDEGLAAADQLLIEWIARDIARDDSLGVATKTAQRGELRLLGALARRRHPEELLDPSLITEAETLIADAERSIPEWPTGLEWGTLIGRIGQVRGQIATARDRPDEMESALEISLEAYERLGLAYEAANCRYLMGCLRLNRANAPGSDFPEHADQARELLSAALGFYDEVSGMRHMAAQARHKLALLYLNAQHRVEADRSAQLRDAADRLLKSAADDFDLLRRQFSSGDRLRSFAGKSQLGADAARVAAEALRLHLSIAPHPAQAWAWVVRSKAQALDDVLGAEARVPPALEEFLRETPDLRALVSRERALTDRLAISPASDRLALGDDLSSLHRQMREHPPLVDYVDLRSGAAAVPRDLEVAGIGAPGPFAWIDWVVRGREIWTFVVRPGEEPLVERSTVDAALVRRFVTEDLSRRRFRMVLRDDPEALGELSSLVAPIARWTEPGEHLILCPSEMLHAVPFQALEVDGEPLLSRNPLGYAPSLGVFRLCRQGIQTEGGTDERRGVRVFGDPMGDRPASLNVAGRIAGVLGTRPIVGDRVTPDLIEEALRTASVFHYQGHALHDPGDPLASSLVLARGRTFEARRLFAQIRTAPRMVSLGACQSAASVVDEGDELLGWIPAFLVAGTRSVVAASWNVEERSAACFMESYFGRLSAGDRPIEALRQAALEVRSRSGFCAPYYWAPYILHGDPWSPLTFEEGAT